MRNIFVALVLATALPTTTAHAEQVIASWYQHGHTTANGERYNPDGFTAAHRTLPFGTIVKVTHNGISLNVRINDRGPFTKGRTIDLSRGAARHLGCIDNGVCKVTMEVVKPNTTEG